MFAILVCVLAFLTPFVIRVLKKYNHIKGFIQHIPAPPAKPIIAHALDFRTTEIVIPEVHNRVQKYGGIFQMSFGFCFPFLVISDIKLIEYILSSTKILEKSQDYKYFKKWLGNGILTSKAAKWSKTRKMITPAFHFQILEQFIDVFNANTKVLLKQFEKTNGKPFDNVPYLCAYTFDVICETSMGISINSQENPDNEYAKCIKELTRIVVERGLNILKQNEFLYLFTKDCWKEKRLVKYVHEFNSKVIEKRKEQLKQKDVKDTELTDDLGRKKRMAFLDLLLQSTIDGKPLENEDIMNEVNTIMFAGHDTTSTALSYILYCLSLNKDVQDKVVEELQDIFYEDKFKTIAHSDIHKMKYLEKVIKESLRLYPPVLYIARENEEDVKYYGGTLPADLPMNMSIYSIHRNPEIYPDPEKFDPERFNPEEQAKRNPFSYIPFSAGARNCLGQKFAMLEMKAALAEILRNFEILPVEGHKLRLAYEVVLKSKNGVYIRAVPRNF